MHLPSRKECQKIVQNSDAFYCAERVVEGQRVEMYDYRLASLSDFQDNNAYELRGICFVLDEDTGEWERNILLNKFFNVDQVEGKLIYEVYKDKEMTELLYTGHDDTEDYNDAMNISVKMVKMPKRYNKIVGKSPSWMYDDVKHKNIKRVQNKEDGSVISFVRFKNGVVRAKSKMSFESEQAQMAQKLYNEDAEFRGFINSSIIYDCTPIFELVGPENQIVLEYHKLELRLLQIRNDNGDYFTKQEMKECVGSYDVKIAEDMRLVGFAEMNVLDSLLHLKETDKSNIEGWIITFEDGQMAKIKTNKYLSMHGLIGPDAFRENLLVRTILDGNMDDVISALVPSPKREKMQELDASVTHEFNKLVIDFKELRRKYFQDFNEVRKDFAIKHSKDAMFSGVMKSLNTSFKDIEQVAEVQVDVYITKQISSLKGAKEWIQKIGEAS